MISPVVLASLCLGALTGPLLAAEPKYKPVDAKTIAAYQELGFDYGGYEGPKGIYLRWFAPSKNPEVKGLPWFVLRRRVYERMESLPDVHVPLGMELAQDFGGNRGWLEKIQNLKTLTALSLADTLVLAKGLQELQLLPNLRELSISSMRSPGEVTDADCKELRRLIRLRSLHIHSSKLTDAGLKELKELTSLQKLDLSYTKVTDVGLRELKDLKELTSLNLSGTNISDAGLKELVSLSNLVELHLFNTKVTDKGLRQLAGLHNLKLLDIRDTNDDLTDEAVRALKQALPYCDISGR